MRPDEVGDVGDLICRAYRAELGTHLNDRYADDLRRVPGHHDPDSVVLTVTADTRPVGCVTFVESADSALAERLHPGECSFRMLAVAPEWQGTGVGRALVDACVRRATDLGRSALVMHSTPQMRTAARLYRRIGFERAPSRDWRFRPEMMLLGYRLALGTTATTS